MKVSPEIANKIHELAKGKCGCEHPECEHKPGECSRDLKNGAATVAAGTPLNEQIKKGRYLCGICRQRTDEFRQQDWQAPRQL